MRFEVIPGVRSITITDFRRALGPHALDEPAVTLTALGDDGTAVRAKVALVDKIAGRGVHRQFACPSCGTTAAVLRVEAGAISCARCRPHRTAHQRLRSTRWWRRFDGKLIDELARLSCRRRAARRLERMQIIADRIATRDRERISTLLADVDAALDLPSS